MTGPACMDPASAVITTVMDAMRKAFDPAQKCPPDGGGTTTVRFFAADGAPLEAWNAHSQSTGCQEPFLWVRVVRRYRTVNFPSPTINVNPCGLRRVIALEVGVARCAVMDADPSWEDYATEAEVSLDDSWHLEMALCAALASLKQDHEVGTDVIVPFGPEGGVLGWSTQAYIQF